MSNVAKVSRVCAVKRTKLKRTKADNTYNHHHHYSTAPSTSNGVKGNHRPPEVLDKGQQIRQVGGRHCLRPGAFENGKEKFRRVQASETVCTQ